MAQKNKKIMKLKIKSAYLFISNLFRLLLSCGKTWGQAARTDQLSVILVAFGIIVALGSMKIGYDSLVEERDNQRLTRERIESQAEENKRFRLDSEFQQVARDLASENIGVKLMALRRIPFFFELEPYKNDCKILIEQSFLNAHMVDSVNYRTWTKALASITNQIPLQELQLSGANLRNADLSGIDLSAGTDSMMVFRLQMDAMTAKMAQKSSVLYQNRPIIIGANLEKADLRGADLTYARLNLVNLRGAKLGSFNNQKTILNYARMVGVYGAGANFENAQIAQADIRRGEFRFANFANSSLVGTDLRNAGLIAADLDSTELMMALLIRANLTSANLNNARLDQANLTGSELKGAILAIVQDDTFSVPFYQNNIPDSIKSYLISKRYAKFE
ncbi:MAG: hypothetical protein ACI8V2_001681 [Candidatus Latescibacterota bacterium]|jgi:uncharacterized protein YjbI with pentapeptide repeats